MFHRIENNLVFAPSQYPAGDWEPHYLTVEDVTFPTTDGVTLHGWYCPSPETVDNIYGDGARPVVLYCHGNAGNLSDRAPNIADWQRHLGVDVFIFDYRGYGKSEGTPSEAGVYLDSRAAHAWLIDEKGVDPTRLMILGRSLGGAIALELALAAEHSCLMLEATFTSLLDIARRLYPWLMPRLTMRTRFPSRERIIHYTKPLLVTHGSEDGLIPVWHGRELYELAHEPKQYYEITGGGHTDCAEVGGRAYFDVVRRFIAESFRYVEEPASPDMTDAST